MKTRLFAALMSLCLLGASCEKENAASTEMKPVQLTEKQQQVISSSNAFGFDFFRKVNEISGSSENMMISPLSVSMALGMTRNGAAGSTLDAMNQTLGMSGLTDEGINESYKSILETFTTLDPKVKLAIANSIWYRNTFSVEQAFLTTNQNYFNAQTTPLDFNDPQSVTTINNWVSENTNQLIPSILDGIPGDMVMYLINAVYFKGQWKFQFEKSNTQARDFYLADGSNIQAESMAQRSTFNYFQGPGFGAVELPYNQGNFNMVVMLPEAGSSVDSVISQLTKENWESWNNNFVATDINLQLPRFRFKYDEKNIKSVLSALGMSIAFDPNQADFTRINAEGGLYISEVKHKTFVETNEEGTEAAAVTSVGVSVTSVGPEPVPFFVNRPFVFVILEKSTGTILFIGTVMNPSVS